PGKPGDRIRGRAARLRRLDLARQLSRLQPPLLGTRQRRPTRALPTRTPLPRLRIHAATEPRARATRLATSLRRLPGPRPDNQHRLRPDRRAAAREVGEADHGPPVV